MRSWFSLMLGLSLLIGATLLIGLDLGLFGGRVYLPNWPVTRAIESAAVDTRLAGGQPPSGMRLLIPALSIDAPIDELGLDSAGQIETPARWDHAGWYELGPRPGSSGIAVVMGHVDGHFGPAVFYRLHELRPGTGVVIETPEHTVRFRVTGLQTYSEFRVPLTKVFVSGGPGRLALLTCAGDFNRLSGRYNDRLLVSAEADG